ncbi:MAG: outer membrane protein transport protein, partial [Thioalkalispiraceae bacterium]
MNKAIKNKIRLAAGVALLTPSLAFATNGYFAHGYGTKNKGLVGGGVAEPQDAMIAATNPAGMVYVGARADVGAAIFSPSPRGYTATAPGGAATFPLAPQTVESDSDYFLIPHFAYNWVINPTSTVGVTVYGNGGMNTDYSASANVFGAGEAGVNLEQLFINASYSVKVNPSNALGVSAILAYQRFEA